MSIKARLEDGMILWDQGRREGAWVLVLVAAAATSRKRYPKSTHNDKESFTTFFHDIEYEMLTGVPWQGEAIPLGNQSMADVVYKHLRCNLVHEAEMHSAIGFSESIIVDGMERAPLQTGAVNKIPSFWVINLAKVIRFVPENVDDFKVPSTVTGSWPFLSK